MAASTNKATRIAWTVIGVLLLIIGLGNIIEDARVLTYDVTAVLAGIGFLLLGRRP